MAMKNPEKELDAGVFLLEMLLLRRKICFLKMMMKKDIYSKGKVLERN